MQFDNLAIGIISFIIGNVTGYLFHKFISKSIVDLDNNSRMNFLVIIIGLGWIVSVLVDMASLQYEASPLIHGLMGTIVGFFFFRQGDRK